MHGLGTGEHRIGVKYADEFLSGCITVDKFLLQVANILQPILPNLVMEQSSNLQ